jgi:fatty acid desaturase
MIAVGVTPCVAALALFWSPPFLLLGLLSLAVMVSAIKDADSRRATPSTSNESPLPTTAPRIDP